MGDQLSWLEHLPYKQGVGSSSLSSPTIIAEIAQLVEQLTCNQQVTGSIPVFGTINGEIAKRLNAADCKSVPSGSVVRIHLSPPLVILPRSQVVRHKTLTLAFRWFESSRGNQKFIIQNVSLAQPVEHLTFNQGVWGSNPQRDTIYFVPQWRNRQTHRT